MAASDDRLLDQQGVAGLQPGMDAFDGIQFAQPNLDLVGEKVVRGYFEGWYEVSDHDDPAAFAAIVTNYQLLSPPLVSATAVVLPWIEAVWIVIGIKLLPEFRKAGLSVSRSGLMISDSADRMMSSAI